MDFLPNYFLSFNHLHYIIYSKFGPLHLNANKKVKGKGIQIQDNVVEQDIGNDGNIKEEEEAKIFMLDDDKDDNDCDSISLDE